MKQFISIIAPILFLFTSISYGQVLTHNRDSYHQLPQDSSRLIAILHPAPPKMQILITGGYGLLFYGAYTHFNQGGGPGGASSSSTAMPSVLGPVYLRTELRTNSPVGFGINAAYAKASMIETQTSRNGGSAASATHNYSTYSIIAQINYHFMANAILDPYMGIGMGYANRKDSYTNVSGNFRTRRGGGGFGGLPTNLPIGADAAFGLNVKLWNQLFANVEVGLNKSLLSGGVQYRLK